MAGGASWTKKWLSFDNEYYTVCAGADLAKETGKANTAADLVWFPTDVAVATDPGFKPCFDAYAKDQALFFRDYASAHLKLSELGAKWKFGKPITL